MNKMEIDKEIDKEIEEFISRLDLKNIDISDIISPVTLDECLKKFKEEVNTAVINLIVDY